MTFTATGGTYFMQVTLASCCYCHLGCYNPGWNSNDPVTNKHNNRGNEFSQRSDGGDVTITYCGDSNNGPVDTIRYAMKAILPAFYQVHNRTQDKHKG